MQRRRRPPPKASPQRLTRPLNKTSLTEWLAYIESLHPEEIELGLDRIRTVFDRLELSFKQTKWVTIAGTNGKGSTLAYLESIYTAAGYRVGSYSSPHLLRYNERVRVHTRDVTDDLLCKGFAAVESARGDVSLTYFEFGTLAALWVFARQSLDLVILEAGLGGRLDAVNIVDSDIAVITSVGIDHRDWLGDTRDQIAQEKAGIFREGKPVVCAEPDPPGSLVAVADSLSAHLFQVGRDFSFEQSTGNWEWRGMGMTYSDLSFPGLPGDHQFLNASAALAVVTLLQPQLPVERQAINQGLATPRMPGRLQVIETRPRVLLDVSHNPQSIKVLSEFLKAQENAGRYRAVIGMLRDKDIADSLQPMLPLIDYWYVTDLPSTRAASASQLENTLGSIGNCAPVRVFADAGQAMQAARSEASPEDVIVVFGSFLTVSAIMVQL